MTTRPIAIDSDDDFDGMWVEDDNDEMPLPPGAGASGFASAASRRVGNGSTAGPANELQAAMRHRAREQNTSMDDRRGSYTRSEDKGRSRGHGYAQTAYEHKQLVDAFSIGRPCLANCAYQKKCGLNIKPINLIRAHEHSYGTQTIKEAGTDGKPDKFTCSLSFAEVQHRRRELARSAISHDALDPTRRSERFLVDGIGPVCAEYCRAAHGVPPGAWNLLLADARAGRLDAKREWDEACRYAEGSLHDENPETSAAKSETIEWWVIWLTLEDQMPNEPVITHRVVVWESVWELEYCADMAWFGTTMPLSRTRWMTLRTVALEQLSVEWFGADDDGKPLAMLSLLERASHSNFSSCVKCQGGKQRWINFRQRKRDEATQEDARIIKEEIYEHIRDVKAQRSAAMRLAQDCAAHRDWSYEYDDACGSDFLYMPSAVRESSAEASRFRYRFAMQCNLISGSLLRLSLIPPCIVKGGNFGCTALFAYMLRLKQLGKLTGNFVRMTDSGPDNDCKTTHAFNWSLVHFGVLKRMMWHRLPPKHSHNYADRVNSMVKEAIHPKKGTGGGCAAPWDFERIVKTAVKTQPGMPELAWHMANANWDKWFTSCECIHPDFADFSDIRVWVYEQDLSLAKHGCVRVTYKETLTTVATAERPYEFMPVERCADGSYRTKSDGLIFMQDATISDPSECKSSTARFPKLATDPGVDAWKHGQPVEGMPEKKTWQQTKVFGDILNHRMLDQTPEQQAQWRALHQFHLNYPTADSVPPLPQTLTADGHSFALEHGSPFDWKSAWKALAWCHELPHKDNASSPSHAGSSASTGAAAAEDTTSKRATGSDSVVNKVTGANNRKTEKAKGKRDDAMLLQAQRLAPKGRTGIKKHDLCFVVTPEPDGELSVGLVRIEDLGSSSDTSVQIAWWIRKQRSFTWSANPIYIPYMRNNRVEKQVIDIESLLSVPVSLTDKSLADYTADKPSIAGLTVKLTKACIDLLRAFVEAHRGDLMNEQEDSSDEGDDEGDSSDEEL